MCMLSAAEGSNSRGKHPLPARPLLPGRSAACWLRPHLPCEEASWGALQPTVSTPAYWKCCCPQPTPWPPELWRTSPTSKDKRLIVPAIITGGRCGAWLSRRDRQQSGGSQDIQEGGVWGQIERHGTGVGERWGRESIHLFFPETLSTPPKIYF